VSFLRPLSIATLLFASACALAADKPPEAAAEQESAPLSPLASEGIERLSVTRERPLFSPTRRPPPPPPPVVQSAAPPPPPPPPPNVALFGVVRDGDEFRAIVRTGPATGTIRVRVGDDIGGWKVAQIERRRLVLVLDDRTATFTMFAGNSADGALRASPEAPPRSPDSKSPTPPQNQSPQNGSTPPPHRRRGSLSLQEFSMVDVDFPCSLRRLWERIGSPIPFRTRYPELAPSSVSGGACHSAV
jgi:general secretion pathway protein N